MMRIDLDGQIALVTGAGKGIGRAIAMMLADCGARVAIHYNSSEREARSLREQIVGAGGRAECFQADLTRGPEAAALIGSVTAAFGGPLDIVVNNAGHLVRRLPNVDMTEAHYEQVMNVNFKSAVLVCQAALQGMLPQKSGAIVNITSVAAHNGGGGGATIYAAGKAALQAYTKGLAKEVAAHGIRVNNVSPGFIGATDFHDTFTTPEAREAAVKSIPLGREGIPGDVAGAVLFLVSDLSSYITGETIEVNGGMFMR